MSKKLTRRVNIGQKVKILDKHLLPEPAESMVAPVLKRPAQHGATHPFGQKISPNPFVLSDISAALPTTKSSAIYSQSSILSTESHSRPTSRSTYCSGYDSADESGTIIVHDYMSDYGESGTSFMSWSDDIDKDTTKKLQDMYDGLEKFLYDEGDFPANAGEDLLEECLLWKQTFPYKRSKTQDKKIHGKPSEDGVSLDKGDVVSMDSSQLSQAIWEEKVTDLVVENLSSVLLSQIVETVASCVSDLRNQPCQEDKTEKVGSRSESRRSTSQVTRLPAVYHKPVMIPKTEVKLTKVNIDNMLQAGPMHIHDPTPHFSKYTNLSVLDTCLGVSSFSELRVINNSSQSMSVFGCPVGNRTYAPQVLEDRSFRSAIPRPVNYPSSTDRSLSTFSSVFAGRKSPRQEAILKSLQVDRLKCPTKCLKNTDPSTIIHSNLVPMSCKPPWIGFSNVTLPPIDYLGESCRDEGALRDNSMTRNRKISPSVLPPPVPHKSFSPLPLEVHGKGMSRLNVAKKLVEQMSKPDKETSRKTKK